jgi:hypothetical protein
MSGLYGMQRANGDWFALDDRGKFRVPVFRSSRDGMQARTHHTGMLLFKPVELGAHELSEIAPPKDVGDIYFWLVDNPFTNLSRGQSMDIARLSLLVGNAAQPQIKL